VGFRTVKFKSSILRLGANKSPAEQTLSPKELPPRSDKDFECVTGPPEGVK
jgi:hypothetical protein